MKKKVIFSVLSLLLFLGCNDNNKIAQIKKAISDANNELLEDGDSLTTFYFENDTVYLSIYSDFDINDDSYKLLKDQKLREKMKENHTIEKDVEQNLDLNLLHLGWDTRYPKFRELFKTSMQFDFPMVFLVNYYDESTASILIDSDEIKKELARTALDDLNKYLEGFNRLKESEDEDIHFVNVSLKNDTCVWTYKLDFPYNQKLLLDVKSMFRDRFENKGEPKLIKPLIHLNYGLLYIVTDSRNKTFEIFYPTEELKIIEKNYEAKRVSGLDNFFENLFGENQDN